MGLGRVGRVGGAAALVVATSALAGCGEQGSTTASPAPVAPSACSTSDPAGDDTETTVNGGYDPSDPDDVAALESMLADGGTIEVQYCERDGGPEDRPDGDPDDDLEGDLEGGAAPTDAAPVPADAPRDPDRPYAWTDDDLFDDGFTVVVADGVAPGRARAALGAVRDSTGGEPGEIGVARAPGGSVLVTLGVIPDDVVAALSRTPGAGTVGAYAQSINADTTVLVMRRGRVLRHLDPLLGSSLDDTSALPAERGLDLAGDPAAASLQLLERVTGIAVGRRVVDRALAAAVVPIDADRD